MPQYFYLENVSSVGNTFAAQAGQSNGQVILWMTPESKNQGEMPAAQAQAQLWEFTADGYIRSASDSELVLTVSAPPVDGDPETVVTAKYVANNDAQRWVTQPGGVGGHPEQGVIINRQNGQMLGTWFQQNAGNNVCLGTYPPSTPYPSNFLWRIAPYRGPVGQVTTLKSRVINSTSGKPDLGVTIPVPALTNEPPYPIEMPEAGTPVVADVPARVCHNAIWQFNAQGCLVSALNSNLALSAAPNNTVAVYLLQPGTGGLTAQPFQMWWISSEGAIVNGQKVNGQWMALTVATDGSGNAGPGAALSLSPYTLGSAAANQLWQNFPGVALQTLLAQPPVAFPTGSGASDPSDSGSTFAAAYAAAYVAINTALWAPLPAPSGGLRAQYSNLVAPLAAYQSMMNALPPQSGSGFSTQDWQRVVQQLNLELTAAQAVRSLFAQLVPFHLGLTQAQSGVLLELGALCSVEPTDTVKFSLTKVLEGLVYTGLSAFGSVDGFTGAKLVSTTLPIIANLLQTGINSYQSTAPTQAAAETLAFSAAQQKILEGTAQMAAGLASLQTRVLTDWGKLSAFYAMTCDTESNDSLYWPASLSPQLIDQLMPGFIVNVLQMLMPSADLTIQRSSFLYSDQPPIGFTPGLSAKKSQYVLNDSWPGYYNTYEVSFGSETLARYLWGSGVLPFNFFLGQDGWNLPVQENNLSYSSLIYFRNDTAETLTVQVEERGTYTANPYSVGSMAALGVYSSDDDTEVVLTVKSTGASMGAFTVNSKHAGCSVNSVATGYGLTSVTNQGVNPYVCTVTLSVS
jgi:hypothetical protein